MSINYRDKEKIINSRRRWLCMLAHSSEEAHPNRHDKARRFIQSSPELFNVIDDPISLSFYIDVALNLDIDKEHIIKAKRRLGKLFLGLIPIKMWYEY